MNDTADILRREQAAIARMIGKPAKVKPNPKAKANRARRKTPLDTRLCTFGGMVMRDCKLRKKPDGTIDVRGFIPTGELPTWTMLAVDGAVRPLVESKQRDHGLRRISKYKFGQGVKANSHCKRAEVHITFARA